MLQPTSVFGAVKSWCNMISALMPTGLIPPCLPAQLVKCTGKLSMTQPDESERERLA